MRSALPPVLETLTVFLRTPRFLALAALVDCRRHLLPGLRVLALPTRTLVPAGLPAAEAFAVLGLAEGFYAPTFDGLLLGRALQKVVNLSVF